jgi:xanthine dehydrogenase accessory factor
MVVSAEETWGSIGGGNVEAVAVDRARALLAEFAAEPTTFTANLSDRAPV